MFNSKCKATSLLLSAASSHHIGNNSFKAEELSMCTTWKLLTLLLSSLAVRWAFYKRITAWFIVSIYIRMVPLTHSRLFSHFPSLLIREKKINGSVIIHLLVINSIDSSCLGNWQGLRFDSSTVNKVMFFFSKYRNRSFPGRCKNTKLTVTTSWKMALWIAPKSFTNCYNQMLNEI